MKISLSNYKFSLNRIFLRNASIAVFIVFLLFSGYLIFLKHSLEVPYPYDRWLKNYDKTWIALSGDQDTILKRKNFARDFAEYFNKKYPRFAVEYNYKPSFEPKYDFLFFSLDSLKKEKELLTNDSGELIGRSFFRDYKLFNSLDFLGKEALSVTEVNENIKTPLKEPEEKTQEFIYDSSSLPTAFSKGEKVNLKYRIKNLSDTTWKKDEVFLITANPEFGKSILFNNKSWLKEYLPATILEDEVAPDETATFEFSINTNIPSGKYQRQYFTLVSGNQADLEFTKLVGEPVYFNFDVYPEFSVLRKDLNNFSDFASFYNQTNKVDDQNKLNLEDIKNVLGKDLFKYDVLESEESDNYFVDDTGYLTTKNEDTILFSIAPKYGFENFDELVSSVDLILQELKNIPLSEDIRLDVVGVPKQIYTLFPKTYFNFFLQLCIFIAITALLTILISRFIVPTVVLTLSLFFGIISAFGLYILTIGSISYIEQSWYLFLLAPLVFIYLFYFFKVLDFKAVQNVRELTNIIEVTNAKYKKEFYFYFLTYLVISLVLLIFLNDLFFIRAVIWIGLNLLFGVYTLLILFPFLINLISKSRFTRFLHLKNYLDFSFVNELINTPFRFSVISLVLFLLLFGLIFTRVNFVKFKSGIPWSKEIRQDEEFINLKYGFNLLYPLRVAVSNYEAIKTLDSYILESKVFKAYDNIFSYIPNNQEEKIGLMQSYLKNINFKELLKKENNWSDSYNVFSENIRLANERINFLINLNNEEKLYSRSREIELLDKAKVDLGNILDALKDAEVSARLQKVELEIDNYVRNLYEKKSMYLEVKNPITIQDFPDYFQKKYLNDDAYLNYLFSFGSIFDVNNRNLIKAEITKLGYEFTEKDLFIDYFKFSPWKIWSAILALVLASFVLSKIILREKNKRIILSLLLTCTYLIFNNTLFNLFNFSFEYITFLIFLIFCLVFYLFSISSLIENENSLYAENPKVAYRALIIMTVSFVSLILLRLPFEQSNIEIYKFFVFSFALIISIFIFYPIFYALIFNWNNPFLKKSKINNLNQVNNAVESSKHSFLDRFLSQVKFSTLTNYFNDYFRNLEIKKIKNIDNSSDFKITDGQKKLADYFNFYKLKEKFLTSFIQSKSLDSKVAIGEKTETKVESIKEEKPEEKIVQTVEPDQTEMPLNSIKSKLGTKRKEERAVQKADVEIDENYDFGFSKYIPIHVFETESELTIEAEIGEINIYDVDVFLDNNILRIKSSNTYKGTPFERHIAINVAIQSSKIDVNVDQGELIISIPKEDLKSVYNEDKNRQVEEKKVVEEKKESIQTEEVLSSPTSKPEPEPEKKTEIEQEQKAVLNEEERRESEKKDLLKEIMQEDAKEEAPQEILSTHKLEQIPHDRATKIDYELKSQDDGIVLKIFLKALKPEDLALSLATKVIRIRNSSRFLGEPFTWEIPIEKDLVYESIKTEVTTNELIIMGKYRPNFISVNQIEDQGQS